MDVLSGIMGYAEIGDIKVRCTDFNVKLSQDVLFYDHIIGLRDSIPTDIFSGKGDAGAFNEQKIFWRASTKIVEGSINFPLSELGANAFLYEACYGDNFDVNLYYSCKTGKRFKYCKVNSYSFTATAGEGANVSVGVMGAEVEDSTSSTYKEIEKLISFDNIEIDGSGVDKGIVSFEFSVNNNCIPIYTAGTNVGIGGVAGGTSNLLVNAIRVGMQTVTGSVTFFNDLGPEDEFVEDLTPRTITITAGGVFSVTLSVLYQYPKRNGQPSPYVRTIPFVGVGRAIQIL